MLKTSKTFMNILKYGILDGNCLKNNVNTGTVINTHLLINSCSIEKKYRFY